MLERIAKSKMSKISRKHANDIVAHLSTKGCDEPLCQAILPKGARWVHTDEWDYRATRDCKNCRNLAHAKGLR